jgi:hypothetical protein
LNEFIMSAVGIPGIYAGEEIKTRWRTRAARRRDTSFPSLIEAARFITGRT